MESNYLNISEASRYTHISRASLYSYTSKLKVPHIKLAGKVLFDKADLDAWLASKKKKEETK